ncbi:124R protein [Yaba-like disease virus]|uniref:124R protein n=1 Tax=Yaba-like disease virus TaxID=132475 RepID=Q9DHI9_YLDV|nr:124R protein [Yaba-like disease virus]CAC21362.1 124R protein [Yaba-like disease virus]
MEIAGYNFIITSFGVIKIHSVNHFKTVCEDLGIVIVDYIGEYAIATLEVQEINVNLINQNDIYDCYVACNGFIVNCSKLNNVPFPVTQVYYAFLTKNKILLCCDKYPKLSINNKIQPFYISSSIYILESKILEVHNLYNKGDYHFIINPSTDFLMFLGKMVNFCLTDKNGWIIVDVKVK